LTPLLWSASNGHEVIVELLLAEETIDANCKDDRGNTALLYAAKNGYCEVVKLLLATGKANMSARNRNGETPLLLAVRENHERVVQLLLESGTTNAKKEDNMVNSSSGVQPPLDAAYNGNDTKHEKTLKRKVDVNAKGKTGETPLLLAAKNNHNGIVKLLLATGETNLNAYARKHHSKTSRTSWRSRNVSGETVSAVNGADSKALHKEYETTPLGYAAYYGNDAMVEMLLATGTIDVNFGEPSTVQEDNDGPLYCQTPLSIASEQGHHAIVKLLLGTGKANVNSTWAYRTPLSYAAGNGHESVVKLLLETENVDVDCKDWETGRTALSYAAEKGNLTIVEDLLATGRANVDSRDRAGRKPLRWAIAKGNEEIAKLLRDKMYQ
jgi:ankyrin repeat protein